jgi:hypothetical protein
MVHDKVDACLYGEVKPNVIEIGKNQGKGWFRNKMGAISNIH